MDCGIAETTSQDETRCVGQPVWWHRPTVCLSGATCEMPIYSLANIASDRTDPEGWVLVGLTGPEPEPEPVDPDFDFEWQCNICRHDCQDLGTHGSSRLLNHV